MLFRVLFYWYGNQHKTPCSLFPVLNSVDYFKFHLTPLFFPVNQNIVRYKESYLNSSFCPFLPEHL
jgi:hypothetical protein